MTDNRKAVQLFSGGLDSILAARLIRDEGIDIIALHFYTGFNGATSSEIALGPNLKWSPDPLVVESAKKIGIRLMPMDVKSEYLEILTSPRYGFGSGVNPCIDCRIFLLKKGRKVMEEEGASFVFTGEVLGQRPMSQHKNTLRQVEKQSGLTGRLLRPLSAQLLEPTIPELEGIVNRNHLPGIQGRSRKAQQELALKYGIDRYPSPGGGCILTDKCFARKFEDLVSHNSSRMLSLMDFNTLKTGRHLRLESGVKVIVGRTESENSYLEKLLSGSLWRFEALDFRGATVFAFDEPYEEDFPKIAAICARYGKGVHEDSVTVIAKKKNKTREFIVKPANHIDIAPLMICQAFNK